MGVEGGGYLPVTVRKYSLKPGMCTPFTKYKIFENDENEEKIILRAPEIYQTAEDDYSKIVEG